MLGTFQTTTGNDVLQLDWRAARKISVGCVLVMFETHSKKRWTVRVTGIRKDKTEFFDLFPETTAERWKRFLARILGREDVYFNIEKIGDYVTQESVT